MKSILKKTRQKLSEFCSGCNNLGGGRVNQIYQPYIEGEKEISEINAEFNNGLVRG